jgi:phosphoheptose isomerase
VKKQKMEKLDFSRIRTYPISQRHNLVRMNDLIYPQTEVAEWSNPELEAIADKVVEAHQSEEAIIWMMGAHVVKCGLSPLLIDLMERGYITHIAGNGAVSIHDFELSMIGETSEDVPHGLEDGSFGMAEETGAWMACAIQAGARSGLGYGAALGKFIAENEELFPYRRVGILYHAYRLGIPATIHVTIGADIIHQHPKVDFAALGAASGSDFQLFTASVSELEGGVFLNFGSAVTGPEVFLKALTIVRNLGYPVFHITTANFDLRPLPDYRSSVKDTEPDYYYRPRKNIVNRPTARGGLGYHITEDHRVTLPNLYKKLLKADDRSQDVQEKTRHAIQESASEIQVGQEARLGPEYEAILADLILRQPRLEGTLPSIRGAFRAISLCFKHGGTLFLAGNGGSLADALHISAELLKSYARPRPLPKGLAGQLAKQPDGDLLRRNLQPGMRAVVLGANLSLSSAVANDMPDRDVNLAQELLALARSGDVFLGISTSGKARNVCLAAQTARALGLPVIVLTGQTGGRLGELADIALRIPAQETARVQELHIQVYHALCEMLEAELIAWLSD